MHADDPSDARVVMSPSRQLGETASPTPTRDAGPPMRRRRHRFTPRFKAEAVRLAQRQDADRTELARRLRVSEQSLINWINQAEAAERGEGPSFDQERELAQTRSQLHVVQTERDILRHAAAYFRNGGVCKFEFIDRHRDRFPVKRLCEILEVARGSYYFWRNKSDAT